ncbi:MAG: TolC family protein [Acidobacteria bacterium]|nr:TolC family protein [Acidobacteriota bacterium]
MSTRLLACALACVCLLPAETLSLQQLIAEALDRNPEVLAAQKNLEAARQRPDQESALPDTMVSVGYASSGRPWPGAGLGREPIANAGFMVTQEFPFFGKRRLRGDIARKEAQAESDQYQSVQWRVVSQLKQAYYQLAHSYQLRDVLERNKALLDKMRKVTEIRYSVGKASQQDVFKIQTQLSLMEVRSIQVEREQHTKEAELLSLANRAPTEKLGEPVMPVPQPLAVSLEQLLAAANGKAPALDRDRRMIERNQIALNLARKDYYPDYAVSAGYFNMGRMADMYQVRLDIKLPTSFFRKQRSAETEQVSRLAAARRMLEATAQSLAFRIKDEFLLAQTSIRLMRAYEFAVVPQASLALESSLSSYETGAVDLLTVLSNFQTILEYQENYHDEMMNAHMAIARLEELTGLSLVEGGRP